jgi:hypothetical protein
MKRCSGFPTTAKMVTKTLMRYYTISTRMAIIKKAVNNNVGEDMENWPPHMEWWKCRIVQSLWKTAWRSPKMLKIESPCNTVILLLYLYPKRSKNVYT